MPDLAIAVATALLSALARTATPPSRLGRQSKGDGEAGEAADAEAS